MSWKLQQDIHPDYFSHLDPVTFSVFKALLSHVNHQRYLNHKLATAWPTLRTLQQETRWSVRTIKRAIATLKALDYLCIERKRTQTGAYDANFYTLNLDLLLSKPAASVDIKEGPDSPVCREKRGHADPQIININNILYFKNNINKSRNKYILQPDCESDKNVPKTEVMPMDGKTYRPLPMTKAQIWVVLDHLNTERAKCNLRTLTEDVYLKPIAFALTHLVRDHKLGYEQAVRALKRHTSDSAEQNRQTPEVKFKRSLEPNTLFHVSRLDKFLASLTPDDPIWFSQDELGQREVRRRRKATEQDLQAQDAEKQRRLAALKTQCDHLGVTIDQHEQLMQAHVKWIAEEKAKGNKIGFRERSAHWHKMLCDIHGHKKEKVA